MICHLDHDAYEHCYCPFFNEFDDWDYLVILDACRYDYFAHFYNFFLKGKLVKVWSCSSNTYEFCVKCLSYNKDRSLIYISANPYINSQYGVKCCKAGKYVKVIDAWHYLWDDTLGTVPPDKLTKTAINIIAKHLNCRVVIHYLQPHAPYIVGEYRTAGYSKYTPLPLFGTYETLRYIKLLSLEGKILNVITLFQKLGFKSLQYVYYKFRGKVGLPPLNPVDALIRKRGLIVLPIAYAYNLLIALANVAILIYEIKKMKPRAKVIVTSDHGECLGEKGLIEHPSLDVPQLREIPFFIVEDVNKDVALKFVLRWKVSLLRHYLSMQRKKQLYTT